MASQAELRVGASLLFVDWKMGGMSGLDLIEELQRRQTQLKIVLMTEINAAKITRKTSAALF